MPEAFLQAMHRLSHVVCGRILTATMPTKDYYSYFKDGKIEAQRACCMLPGVTWLLLGDVRTHPALSDCKARDLLRDFVFSFSETVRLSPAPHPQFGLARA